MHGPHLTTSPTDQGRPDDHPASDLKTTRIRFLLGRHLAGLIGLVLLVIWGNIWVGAFRADGLELGETLWIPHLDFIAGDFVVHIARTGKLWAAGGNPYEPEQGWLAFPYPPLVPRLFTWTSLTGTRDAVVIWWIALTALAVAATYRTARTRGELGLRGVPRSVLIAAFLFSTPIMFAMERGQCDILVLPLLAGGVAALRRGTRPLDILAGLLFVLAAYVKYYPGLVLVGLVAFRRWPAVASFVGFGAVIGLIDLPWLLGSKANMKIVFDMFIGEGRTTIHLCEHSLSTCWRPLWEYWGVPSVAQWDGKLAAPLVILPMVGVICLKVARSARREVLLWPLLLWVVAAATFIPPMANDYNLMFLPLAALAVWDRRDPPWVHALMAYLILWWQPFDLGIDGALLLTFKLGGLLAVGLSLGHRAAEAREMSERTSASRADVSRERGAMASRRESMRWH